MFDEREFRKRLISAGLSVKEIAKAIGINEATLYRKINGKSDFSRNEMSIIKSVLSLNQDDFESIFFA